MRSIRQTFRRPQLMAPIVVFPTLLLAIQTGGAGGAVDLPGFPPVQSFLQFMLAGAMMQSLMLAGNSGGIALAVDIEMGFTDRLFSAPIPRYTIVLGRLAGTAALGLFSSLWFLAIGLIFGAEIHSGVAGALIAIALVTATAMAVGGIGAAIALRTGSASVVQGLFPLVLVVLFLSSAFFPIDLMIQPAKAIAEYNPLSFIVEGIRGPIVSGVDATDLVEALLAIAGIVVLEPGAQRPRPATPAEGGLMEPAATLPQWRANLATIAALMARAKNELLRVPGAAIPGVLAPTIFFLGLNGVFGALTQLNGFTTGTYESFIVPVSMLQGAGFTGAAAGVNLARDIERGWVDRLLVSPAPRWVLLAGTVLAASARALIPATFVFVIALLLGAGWPGIDGLLVTYLMVAAMAAVAACWGSALALRFKSQSAAPLMQAGMMALILTTTAYAPLALLQPWMRSVAEVNPVTEVIEAARQGFVGSVSWAETWPGIVALLGLLIVLGAWALREMRRTAR